MTNNNDTKLIPLSQGKYAIIDADDYERINQWRWHITNNGYAARSKYIRMDGKKQINTTIMMHRVILGTEGDLQIDHIDGNKLNNKKSNLRKCSRTENAMNTNKKSGCTSKYKGVWRDKIRHKWVAEIRVNKKKISLGGYISEREAALAYNSAALNYFGEFARVNQL